MMADLSRRSFLFGATATLAVGGGYVMTRKTVDDSLTVFLADLHVRNEECYQYRYCSAIIEDILAMNPRPKRVVVFGDLAYLCGLKHEYETSRRLLERLLDAGMELTFGMGNHDRRSTFFEVWPEYRTRTLLPGKIVTSTNLGAADLLMLDGLQGSDERAASDMGPVVGKLDVEQQKWLYGYLAKLKRPTFLASHFPIGDMCGTGRRLEERLCDYPAVVGYIYGHKHRWEPHWVKYKWGVSEVLRTLGLPSTGHWGDIGYVTFKTSEHKAEARFIQKDFFFNAPVASGIPRPQVWDDILEECGRNTICTFRY